MKVPKKFLSSLIDGMMGITNKPVFVFMIGSFCFMSFVAGLLTKDILEEYTTYLYNKYLSEAEKAEQPVTHINSDLPNEDVKE